MDVSSFYQLLLLSPFFFPFFSYHIKTKAVPCSLSCSLYHRTHLHTYINMHMQHICCFRCLHRNFIASYFFFPFRFLFHFDRRRLAVISRVRVKVARKLKLNSNLILNQRKCYSSCRRRLVSSRIRSRHCALGCASRSWMVRAGSFCFYFLSGDVEDWRFGDAEMRRCGGTNCGLYIVYVRSGVVTPAVGVEGLWDVTVLRMTLGPLVPRYMDFGHILGSLRTVTRENTSHLPPGVRCVVSSVC